MTTLNNVKLTIDNVAHTFTKGTYNGMNIIVDDETGFVNATSFCNQFNKRFRKIFENHSWQEYIDEFEKEYYKETSSAEIQPTHDDETSDKTTCPKKGTCSNTWIYELNKGIPDSLKQHRGKYIDPRLINYIALWVNPRYAITVGKIMDSINDSVHEKLEQKQLPDTPENTKIIFEKKVEEIVHNDIELENKQCWGVRDSPNKLDSWEQMDLKRDVEAYNKCKSALLKAKEAVKSWSAFVHEYFPDFDF